MLPSQLARRTRTPSKAIRVPWSRVSTFSPTLRVFASLRSKRRSSWLRVPSKHQYSECNKTSRPTFQPRSTSLNVLVTVGNVAAVLGNCIFSALLDVECLVGFMGIGCLLFGESRDIFHAFLNTFSSLLSCRKFHCSPLAIFTWQSFVE